jgi:hypothetical protein
MALTVVWEKMSVDKADGTPVTLLRGETLPDYVDDFHRSAFVMIGAVKDVQTVIAQTQAAADAEFETPPPPPIYPPEVPPVTPDVTPVPVVMEPMAKPSVSDNKDAWEAYAVAREYMSKSEAEALTKTKLIAEVGKRESV